MTLVLRPVVTRTGLGVGGALVGAAVWFRPEFLCLVAALGAVAGLGVFFKLWGVRLTWGHLFALGSGMALSVGLFFAVNLGVYGHPLGIHSVQIVEESSVGQQIAQAQAGYQQLLTALFRYFPLVLLGLAAPLLRPLLRPGPTKRTDSQPTAVLLWVGVLFALAVPLIVPPGAGGKQWGPRFYLILVPMTMWIIAPLLAQIWASKAPVKAIGLAAFTLLFAIGLQTNAVNGVLRVYSDRQTQSISLAKNHGPIAPAVQALTAEVSPWVAMSHQFVAQQLWPSVREKTFFLTETPDALFQLSDALLTQGESEFLYICYPHRDCPVPDLATEQLKFETTNGPHQLVFSPATMAGKYPFHQVRIRPFS
ncbi:MAG: hypothetical protein AAFZ80_02840 [Cyanobacteria bacterium P01_A01_bin.105]